MNEKSNVHIERQAPSEFQHLASDPRDHTHAKAVLKAEGHASMSDPVFEDTDLHLYESMQKDFSINHDSLFHAFMTQASHHAESRLMSPALSGQHETDAEKSRMNNRQAEEQTAVKAKNELAALPHQTNHQSEHHNQASFFHHQSPKGY